MKNKKGMSLIELITLIAIIGIMSAVSISSMVRAKRNSELEAAAEEIMAVLREAQNYSLTGKSITATCSNYTVDFTNASVNYRLHNGLGACQLNQLYTLKNNVQVTVSTDTVFSAPHGDISGLASGWRTITVSKAGSTMNICINSAGLIKKMTAVCS